MWLAPLTPVLLFTALGPPAAGGFSATQPPVPEPIATRQTLFAIPFTIAQPEHPSQEPGEVQLFVSPDRGANWHLYSKAAPNQQQFLFRAGGDGEYWFQVRTLDRTGQMRPQSAMVPALHVVVDTTPPKLVLTAEQGPAGQVTARWQIEEPRLKPESLILQYRTSDAEDWEPVAVGAENWQVSETTQTGELSWWPKSPGGEIQIRAEVADAAGNPAVVQTQVVVDRVAQSEQPLPSQTSQASQEAVPPWRAGEDPPSTPWPPEHAADPPPAAVTGALYPPIRNQFIPTDQPATPQPQDGLPPGERLRMVNSRLFELQYDVEGVAPSGLSRVELWGTQDGGRTWQRFATDNDNRSPMLVTVDREGTCGFRVVVTSKSGLGGQPPQPGSLPQIVIGVDLTEPTAQILSADPGTGPEAGSLIVTWSAADERLAELPVTLSFSASPAGPWTPVAAGLENTGRYAWPVDPRLPEQIYLRLEVRDEAGNVGTFETPQAVMLNRRRPEVHIRGVRPLGQGNRAGGLTPGLPYGR